MHPTDASPPNATAPDETEGPSMRGTYVGVMVLEAVIIILLWVFGRMFS
jgi:hypothetical protein